MCVAEGDFSDSHIMLGTRRSPGNARLYGQRTPILVPHPGPALQPVTATLSYQHSHQVGHLWSVQFTAITRCFSDRLGPGTHCCSTCTWKSISGGNKIQRNYKRLNITACMGSWGKLWTIRYKKTRKPNCHFWRPRNKSKVSGAKAGSCTCPLHSTPQRGGQTI